MIQKLTCLSGFFYSIHLTYSTVVVVFFHSTTKLFFPSINQRNFTRNNSCRPNMVHTRYPSYSYPKQEVFGSSKLTEFADDNFKFNEYENGKKYPQMDRKRCGKRGNCSLRAISPFPTVFSKDLY